VIQKIDRAEARTEAPTISIRDCRVLLEIKAVIEMVGLNATASTLPLDQLPESALDELERAREILDSLDVRAG
jgi:hypothetical protein